MSATVTTVNDNAIASYKYRIVQLQKALKKIDNLEAQYVLHREITNLQLELRVTEKDQELELGAEKKRALTINTSTTAQLQCDNCKVYSYTQIKCNNNVWDYTPYQALENTKCNKCGTDNSVNPVYHSTKESNAALEKEVAK